MHYCAHKIYTSPMGTHLDLWLSESHDKKNINFCLEHRDSSGDPVSSNSAMDSLGVFPRDAIISLRDALTHWLIENPPRCPNCGQVNNVTKSS